MSIFHKDSKSKDLDSWLNKPLKVKLHDDAFYKGVLVEEQRNGILIEAKKKRVYVPYESVLSLEEE